MGLEEDCASGGGSDSADVFLAVIGLLRLALGGPHVNWCGGVRVCGVVGIGCGSGLRWIVMV